MAAKYYVTLTEYGSSLIAQAHDIASIQLTEMVLGDANGVPYDPIDKKNRTTLVNQRATVPIQSVQINGVVTTVTATLNASIGGFNLHEIGLKDSEGKLVYIGNYHGGYKPAIADGAGGELTIIIDITVESGKNALLSIDPNVVTANKDWVLNTLNNGFKIFADQVFHIGSWHGSNNPNYDPATALQQFFGYQTNWVLWPYIPKGVTALGDAIGAISGLDLGSSFQSASTRIWQRLEDGASAPTYELNADKTIVDEGGEVTFTIQTTGLAAGTPVDWTITGIQSDDISPALLIGQFILDSTGKASTTLNIIADNKTEGNQTLTFKLTYIQKQVSVLIMDTSKYPEGQVTYYEGTHSLIVEANQSITIDMFGAGGGGGGSIYTGGDPNCSGTDGGNVVLSSGTNTITAGGGKGGTGGVWGNGSSFTNGEGGDGGIAVVSVGIGFLINVQQNGTAAVIGSRWSQQVGALGISSSIGTLNSGGAGAWGIGDEKWAFGGGGGSGARVQAQFTNNSEEQITMSLVVGSRGLGWKNAGNYGEDGGIAFALVTTS